MMNWATEVNHNQATDRDHYALEKAKAKEKQLVKKGHRWYAINARTKILVECDEHGHPTEHGHEQIERYTNAALNV